MLAGEIISIVAFVPVLPRVVVGVIFSLYHSTEMRKVLFLSYSFSAVTHSLLHATTPPKNVPCSVTEKKTKTSGQKTKNENYEPF